MWPRMGRKILVVLGVIALFVVTRLPSIPFHPLNIDESVYAAAAVRCSHLGQLPYVGAVDVKGPLLHWTYQLVFRLAGDYNLPAVHLVGAIIVALNTAMVWHMARRCFGAYSGPSAAVLYLLAMGSDWDYLSFNAEMPASLPLVLANWLVLTARRPMGPLRCLLAGALVMTAAGFRQNALIAYPVVCLGAAALSWAADRRIWPALGRGVLVGLGGLISVALVVLIYARQGALAELVFCYFGHNTKYYLAASELSVVRVVIAAWQLSAWLNDTALLSLLSLVGLVPIFWKVGVSNGAAGAPPEFQVPRPQGWYLGILSLTMWAGVSVGLRFFPHYRMLDWPFSAVLAAGGWVLLLGQLRQRHTRIAFKVAGIVVLTALGFRGAHAIYVAGPWAAKMGPIHVEPHVLDIALRLRANTTPQDSLFVWGMQPQIYQLAHRRMATRFAHTSPQVGLLQYENYVPLDQDRSACVWPGSLEQMMEDLGADPPAYVVDASQDYIFALGQYPISAFPEFAEWLEADYVYDFEQAGPQKSLLVIYRRRERSPTDLSQPLEYTVRGHPGRFP